MTDNLLALAEQTKCNFHLEFNPHKSYYEDAKEYIVGRHGDEPFYDEVGDIDYDKDIWTIQVYPRTPVGFIAAVSNNPFELLYWAINGAKEY